MTLKDSDFTCTFLKKESSVMCDPCVILIYDMTDAPKLIQLMTSNALMHPASLLLQKKLPHFPKFSNQNPELVKALVFEGPNTNTNTPTGSELLTLKVEGG